MHASGLTALQFVQRKDLHNIVRDLGVDKGKLQYKNVSAACRQPRCPQAVPTVTAESAAEAIPGTPRSQQQHVLHVDSDTMGQQAVPDVAECLEEPVVVSTHESQHIDDVTAYIAAAESTWSYIRDAMNGDAAIAAVVTEHMTCLRAHVAAMMSNREKLG